MRVLFIKKFYKNSLKGKFCQDHKRQSLRQRHTKSKYINQYVKRFQEIDKTHKCVWRKREKSNESLTHWPESQALQIAKREEILAMIMEI